MSLFYVQYVEGFIGPDDKLVSSLKRARVFETQEEAALAASRFREKRVEPLSRHRIREI